MSDMIARVSKAMAARHWERDWQAFLPDARAAIEAIPLEKLIVDAYVRGVEWCEENPLDREYRFKAAFDYADAYLSQDTHSPSPLNPPADEEGAAANPGEAQS